MTSLATTAMLTARSARTPKPRSGFGEGAVWRHPRTLGQSSGCGINRAHPAVGERAHDAPQTSRERRATPKGSTNDILAPFPTLKKRLICREELPGVHGSSLFGGSHTLVWLSKTREVLPQRGHRLRPRGRQRLARGPTGDHGPFRECPVKPRLAGESRRSGIPALEPARPGGSVPTQCLNG